jgi:hypothetical protein
MRIFSQIQKIFLPILNKLKELGLGEPGEIHQIEGARAMDSLQDWRYMMRFVLAPKSMEGIEEKLLKS